jgi:hypothetical protein
LLAISEFVEDFTDDVDPARGGFDTAADGLEFHHHFTGFGSGLVNIAPHPQALFMNFPGDSPVPLVDEITFTGIKVPLSAVDQAALEMRFPFEAPFRNNRVVFVSDIALQPRRSASIPIVRDAAGSFRVAMFSNQPLADGQPLGPITSIQVVAEQAFFVDDVTVGVSIASQPPPDTDQDGVPDEVEDAHGDGNLDDVADSAQAHVASLPNAADGRFVTLAAPVGTRLSGVEARDLAPPHLARLPLGAFHFTVTGFAPGSAATVTMYLPPQVALDRSFKLGASSSNPLAHWYEFPYSAETDTGAELIDSDGDQFIERIVLHLVDGGAGDDDRQADGRIVDPFAPGLSRTGTGEIHGVVWHDVNFNGIRDDVGGDGFPDEPGQVGATVYLDLNQNGQRDAAEPFTVSLSQGRYSFLNLPPGGYFVALDLQTAFGITLPPEENPPAARVEWVTTHPAAIDDQRISVGDRPVSITAVDFNSDGAPDMAVLNELSNDVSLAFNRFDGTFNPATPLPTFGTEPVMLLTPNLLPAGFPPELVVVNEGSDSITLPVRNQTIQVGDGPRSAAAGDFNGDGRVDLAVLNVGDQTITLLFNDGTFVAPTITTIAAPPRSRSLAAADFNGDLKLDLAIAGTGLGAFEEGHLSLLLGDGNGTFSAGTEVDLALGWSFDAQLAAGDLDDDGDLDLILPGSYVSGHVQPDGGVAFFTVPALYRFMNDGTGQFDAVRMDVSEYFTSVTAADLSPAPGLELALTAETGLWVLADGQFTEYPVGLSPQGSVALDADGDGDLDLFVANAGSDDVSLLRNHGDGRFDPAVLIAHQVRLGDGEIVPVQNFGVSRLPEIRGTIWDDQDGDEVVDPEEPFLAGWTVYVDLNQDNEHDGGEYVAITDAAGTYQFAGLSSGTYRVVEQLQAGWHHPRGGQQIVTVVALEDVATVNFGNFQNVGEIRGNVYHDLNDDGLPAGEPGLAGWTVFLDLNHNGHFDGEPAAVTDAAGDYRLGNLARGEYSVGQLLKHGWWSTHPGAVEQTYEIMSYAAQPSFETLNVDLNGDGRLDAVTAASGIVSVLINDAATPGAFQPAANYAVDGSGFTRTVAVDVNGDSRLDLVTANQSSDSVWVLINNVAAPGTFLPAVNYPVGLRPSLPLTVDVNGDGRPDLVTANADSDNLSVLINNAAAPGTFLTAAHYAARDGPSKPIAVDVNGDGRPDLMALNFYSGNVSVLISNAAAPGTFLPAANYPVGNFSRVFMAVDLNGDGRLDLVTANGVDVSVLINNGAVPGTFQPAANYSVGSGQDYTAADLDGDGRLDLVTANRASDDVSVLLNNAAAPGTFLPVANYPVGNGPGAHDVVDLNGDGRLDLVTSNYDSGNVSVLIGNAATPGTFLPAENYPFGNFPRNPVAVDVNNDGQLDLVTANLNSVSVLFHNAATPGTFLPAVNYPVVGRPLSHNVVDVNGDERPDVVVATSTGVSVALSTHSHRATVRVVSTAVPAVLDFGNQPDQDRDGLSDSAEVGDGNQDLVPDGQQPHVALLQYAPGDSVTLESAAGTQLVDVRTETPLSAPPAGVSLPAGLLAFDVAGVTAGDSTTVTLILDPPLTIDTYYKFGREQPGDTVDWYEWLYGGSGTTGAEFFNAAGQVVAPHGNRLVSRILLHFVDGERGDDDHQANGQITDPSGPAIVELSPQVASVVLNDGHAQRSMINSLTVTFSERVTIDPGAFELRREGSHKPIKLQVSLSEVDGQTVARLTFKGSGVRHGSLQDGRYTLSIIAGKIHDSDGRLLDGDGDGLTGDSAVEEFFRRFGDTDGDNDVDRFDAEAFAVTFGKRRRDAEYLWYLDINNNGRVSFDDLARFVLGMVRN